MKYVNYVIPVIQQISFRATHISIQGQCPAQGHFDRSPTRPKKTGTRTLKPFETLTVTDATDFLVRKVIFGMSHGLTNHETSSATFNWRCGSATLTDVVDGDASNAKQISLA